MRMTRRSLIISGLVGVAGAVLLTGCALVIAASGWIPVLVTNPLLVWAIFLFLLFFSVAEIPLMVYGLERIAASNNPKAGYLALLTNTGYTFFAGVYAVPFILLAGKSIVELAAGAFLGALTFVRLISTLLFLPGDKPNELQ